ncbi:MAG: hypothetical protein R3E31_20410 [Chloroflexota bacterium]
MREGGETAVSSPLPLLFRQHLKQLVYIWPIYRIMAGMRQTDSAVRINNEITAQLMWVALVCSIIHALLCHALNVVPQIAWNPDRNTDDCKP